MDKSNIVGYLDIFCLANENIQWYKFGVRGDQGGCVAMVPRGLVRTPKQRQGQLLRCCGVLCWLGVSEASSPIVAAIRHLPRALSRSGDVESGESVGGSL